MNYTLDNPWREPIESWLANPQHRFEYVTAELLLTDAVGKPVERQTRWDQMQVASILRELGYSKKRINGPNGRKWVYSKDSEQDS